jgi:hypothetical protein
MNMQVIILSLQSRCPESFFCFKGRPLLNYYSPFYSGYQAVEDQGVLESRHTKSTNFACDSVLLVSTYMEVRFPDTFVESLFNVWEFEP